MTSFLSGSLPQLPHMDYEGQKLAERIFQIVLVSFGIVGFIWGYVCQRFSQTVIVVAAGFVLSCILILPPWPFYRRHPVKWHKPRSGEKAKKPKK
ncbi:signal peptidase complex subunit 1-like [Oscarella lobularis]|uniref:signal peptidase complex subunit 1-like n=1 Tax=Oscarella lobularis TaxID=121494 RepID=UPI0033133C77